jgi:hypothetical protein
MSPKRAKVIGLAAAMFAGIAGGEAFTYATVHQMVHLVVAAIAALVAVVIVGATALTTRRRGNSDAANE